MEYGTTKSSEKRAQYYYESLLPIKRNFHLTEKSFR